MSESEDEAVDRLYGDSEAITSGYRPAFMGPVARLQDARGLSDADRDEIITDAALAFNDAKIAGPQATRLLSRMIAASLERPDEVTIAKWETESRRVLRENYGEAEAETRLQTVRDFVAARPHLARLIADGGGSHPDVVAAFAAQARTLRVTPPSRKSSATPRPLPSIFGDRT